MIDFQRRLRQTSKLAGALRQGEWRRALPYGVAPALEHLQLRELPSIRTVIDVGANKGQFALVAAVLFPNAHLWCIEPLPKPRARAARVLRPFAERLSLIDCAIGSADGTGEMRVTSRDDSSSLLAMTPRQAAFGGGLREVGRHTVVVRRLDQVVSSEEIKRPALIKIDVQGYELEVLKGSMAILPFVDYLYIECSYVELYAGQPTANEITTFV